MDIPLTRKPYPSDLSDKEWALIEPILEESRDPRGRKQKYQLRAIVNGFFLCTQNRLSVAFAATRIPALYLVHKHFRKWCKRGSWGIVLDALNGVARKKSSGAPARMLSSSTPMRQGRRTGPGARL